MLLQGSNHGSIYGNVGTFNYKIRLSKMSIAITKLLSNSEVVIFRSHSQVSSDCNMIYLTAWRTSWGLRTREKNTWDADAIRRPIYAILVWYFLQVRTCSTISVLKLENSATFFKVVNEHFSSYNSKHIRHELTSGVLCHWDVVIGLTH